MIKLELNSIISIENKSYTVESLIKDLRTLAPEQYVAVFSVANIKLPIQLRMEVIRNLTEPFVKKSHEIMGAINEDFINRLKWFYQYSDFQYVNLLSYYENENIVQTYIDRLLVSIFEYLVNIKRESVIELLIQANRNQSTKYDFKNIKNMNNIINRIFFDKDQEVDGLSLDQIRPVLFKGTTLKELREFGEKYGVDVPRRLKKQQILDILYSELSSRDFLTDFLKDELKSKSIVMIQRYAKNHGIELSTELKKEQIIEYILQFSNHSKAFYSPPNSNIYDVEIDSPFEVESESMMTKPAVDNHQYEKQTSPNSNIELEMQLLREEIERLKRQNINQAPKDEVEQTEASAQMAPDLEAVTEVPTEVEAASETTEPPVMPVEDMQKLEAAPKAEVEQTEASAQMAPDLEAVTEVPTEVEAASETTEPPVMPVEDMQKLEAAPKAEVEQTEASAQMAPDIETVTEVPTEVEATSETTEPPVMPVEDMQKLEAAPKAEVEQTDASAQMAPDIETVTEVPTEVEATSETTEPPVMPVEDMQKLEAAPKAEVEQTDASAQMAPDIEAVTEVPTEVEAAPETTEPPVMPVEDMQKLEEAPKDEVEQTDASAQMAPDIEAVTEVPTEVEAAPETTEPPVMPVEDMQKLEEAPKDEVEQTDASAQMAPDIEAVTEVPTEVEAAPETTEPPVMPVEDMQKLEESPKDEVEQTDASAQMAPDVKEETESERIDQAIARAVKVLFDTLTVPYDRNTVEDAREAYDALTAMQQLLVTNYQALLDAEQALIDIDAAAEVDAKIELLTSPYDRNAVEDDREAYEALTTTQQALVENYQKLLDAEQALEDIDAAPETTEPPVMPVEDMQKEKKELFFELVVLQIIFKITLRILIFVSVTVIILGLIFVTYALISYLSNNATLNMINDQINKIEFLGKGLIDFVFDLFRRIGV